MNTYEVEGKQFAIIEGELWLKVESTRATPVIRDEQPVTKRAYKVKKPKGRHLGRKVITSEQENEIIERFKRAESIRDIAESMGLNYQTVAKRHITFTRNSHSTKNNEIKSYVCVDGHEFKSKMPFLDIVCPVCHSTDVDYGSLNGKVKEGEE